jgi:hypothetical protein
MFSGTLSKVFNLIRIYQNSFKVVRSQLGQYNPYYTPVSKDDDDAEEENEGWEPLETSKHGKHTAHTPQIWITIENWYRVRDKMS